MTDKKFNDEEIIEALYLCTQQNGSIPCYNCPCWNDDEQECKGIDYTATLDLIKRQKAEIEELKIENKSLRSAANCYKLHYNEARTEAYKEFAEKLKQKSEYYENGQGWEGRICYDDDIDKLLKEMAGEE